MPRLPGLRRAPEGESPQSATPPATGRAVRRALPPAGQLRRERRGLLQLREARLRDLGGLMLEMYRRDQFRQDLLVDRCTELATIEERSEEHTSELQSHSDLVCRLLLEKKTTMTKRQHSESNQTSL